MLSPGVHERDNSITGGSISIGDVLRVDEGTFLIDDSSAAITSISVRLERPITYHARRL